MRLFISTVYNNIYLILAVISAVHVSTVSTKGKPKVICYFSTWKSPYGNIFRYDVLDIPYELCDTLVKYHDKISANDFSILPLENEYERKFLESTKQHKIPVYLALGSYETNLKEFSSMNSIQHRTRFFENIEEKFQMENQYTGLLIDWAYPSLNGNMEDKATYIQFLQFLHEQFQIRNWTLAISGANDQRIIDNGYDLSKIRRYVDEVHVNCHHFPDFFGNAQITKDHSSLYSELPGADSVEKVMNIWSEKIPREKLYVAVYILGVRRTNRPISYFQVCTYLTMRLYKEEWNPKAKVEHATSDNPDSLISYETVQSLQEKARYVRSQGYGGIAFKFVNDDDFRGFCGRKNTLLKSVRDVFDEL